MIVAITTIIAILIAITKKDKLSLMVIKTLPPLLLLLLLLLTSGGNYSLQDMENQQLAACLGAS